MKKYLINIVIVISIVLFTTSSVSANSQEVLTCVKNSNEEETVDINSEEELPDPKNKYDGVESDCMYIL